jgi:predicted O-methyltransferase YrrM
VVEEGGLVAAVREMRRTLASNGPRFARAEGDFERVALPIADGDVLRDLVVAERAMTVVEIGLAYGSSALAIGEALAAGAGERAMHVIIDPYQDRFGNAGWDAITAAGLADRCSLLVEPSQLALPRLVADGFVADAAFVDGSHIFHHVFVDLAFLRELVRPGGLVVLDDCDWPSVATAVRYFERNTGWRPQPIDRPTRLRAFRLPDPPIEPSFEAFQPFTAD